MNQTPHAHVVDATSDTFEQEVMVRSHHVPVVVDFWAPWCGPCRMLGPILLQLAEEYEGRFVLVKVNTDEVPERATEFGVSGIPAVFGVVDGQIVDFFQGALPVTQIRPWLDRLLPSEAQALVRQAREVISKDADAAETMLRRAQELEPNLADASILLAELYMQQKRWDAAGEVIEQLAARGFLEPEAERVRATLQQHAAAEQAGSVSECEAACQAEPDNLSLQLKLAQALAGEQLYQRALEISVNIVQADHGELREAARQFMVDIFHLLPEDSELTSYFRRELSAALY